MLDQGGLTDPDRAGDGDQMPLLWSSVCQVLGQSMVNLHPGGGTECVLVGGGDAQIERGTRCGGHGGKSRPGKKPFSAITSSVKSDDFSIRDPALSPTLFRTARTRHVSGPDCGSWGPPKSPGSGGRGRQDTEEGQAATPNHGHRQDQPGVPLGRGGIARGQTRLPARAPGVNL